MITFPWNADASMAPLKQREAQVAAWLEAFPEPTRTSISQWRTDHPHAWVVDSAPILSKFRLNPRKGLALVGTIARRLGRRGDAIDVLWLIENRDNHGLDGFEAEAVLGAWLDLAVLEQENRGQPASRLIAAGALRTERLGVAFALLPAPTNRFAEWSALMALLISQVPVAVVYVDHVRAASLARQRTGLTSRLLRRLARRGVAIGLLVPPERSDRALADARAEVAPVEALGGEVVRYVHFMDAAALKPPGRLAMAMADAQLTCDTSLNAAPPVSPSNGASAGPVPYLRGGAYQPLSFDVRAVAGLYDEQSWIEVVSTPLDSETPQQAWSRRAPDMSERLILLLDFSRMERYHVESESSLELMQQYHQYRVYNWPPPDPSPRVTLFDAGWLDRALRVTAVLRQLRSFESQGPPKRVVVGSAALLQAARQDARKRAVSSPAVAMKAQTDAHQYLDQISFNSPLREDCEDFARFIPDAIGPTLELGSGYGTLARTLSCRAGVYVCLELDLRMLAWASRNRREVGVIGDAHHLPFGDCVFQSVVVNNVLEHMYDPLGCLREIRRSLRPDGRLYALIPLDMRNPSHQLRAHRWKADEESIAAALTTAGFELDRCDTVDLYALGVRGCFPSCDGLVLKIAAVRREADRLNGR